MLILFLLLILVLSSIFVSSIKRSEKQVKKMLSEYIAVNNDDKIRIKIKEILKHRGSALLVSHDSIKLAFPYVLINTLDHDLYLDDFILADDSIIKQAMNDTVSVKRNTKEYFFISIK